MDKIKEMLKANTNMSEHDIEKHINDGIMVYESFEEFKNEWIAGMNDEEEAQSAYDKLDTMAYDGKEYKVDFVL